MFEAPTTFDEAVDWFRARVPMTKDQWDALTTRARQQAFTVAGVADLDMVAEVWRALDKAVSKGTTFADFADSVRGPLESAWGGEKPFRLETIFRTNVQLAYSAGRQQQQSDPAVLAQRPFWKYSAILDSRTTGICRECNGKVIAADDPWWASHQPPLHFNCRSTVISLTRSQAEAAGIAEAAPEVEPSDGFGDPMKPWAPSSKDYPHDLWHAYEGGAGKGGGSGGGSSGGGGSGEGVPPKKEPVLPKYWPEPGPQGPPQGDPTWRMLVGPGGILDEDLSQGRVIEKQAVPLVELLVEQGNYVRARTLVKTPGVKNPDITLNAGAREDINIVELTSITGKSGGDENALRNVLNKKLKKSRRLQDAEALIIDSRGSGLSEATTISVVPRFWDKASRRGAKFIRVVGDSFDLTFWGQP